MELLHVVYASTLVKAEHVVALLSLLLTILATFRYRASSMCFVQCKSFLVHLLFSGGPALLFGCNIKTGNKALVEK